MLGMVTHIKLDNNTTITKENSIEHSFCKDDSLFS